MCFSQTVYSSKKLKSKFILNFYLYLIINNLHKFALFVCPEKLDIRAFRLKSQRKFEKFHSNGFSRGVIMSNFHERIAPFIKLILPTRLQRAHSEISKKSKI